MEDCNHKIIEQVNFIENFPNPGQDMANLIEVNQEIEQRTRTKKKIFLDVLHLHIAFVRREG